MKDEQSDEFHWDWITFSVALLVAVVLAAALMEVWMPHGSLHVD